MLEKPNLPDSLILSRLADEYGIQAAHLSFLPIGADINTAVYRTAADGLDYFLKLRKGPFDPITVEVPRFLHSLGINEIIAPLETREGRLWGSLEPYKMILYPFIAGQDGYQMKPSPRQWAEFGAAMRKIHAARLPEGLAGRIPREEFTPYFRDLVREYQEKVEQVNYTEPVAARLAAFMREQREGIRRLVDRAEGLAGDLKARGLEFVLCHSDIHPGNLHLAGDSLYIVDWDNPFYAPRERDLMLIGGSSTWSDPREAELFYQGYGGAKADRAALAYYRCERIIWDIAAFCEQLLESDEGDENREQAYRWFVSNFAPGGEIEIAMGT